MGNNLTKLQQELSDANSDTGRDAKEILDCLEDMARDRLDLFFEKIGCASSLLLSITLT